MKQFQQSRILPKALTPQEWVNLIKIVPLKDKQARVAFLLAYGSGLRIGEVLRLQKENIRENHVEIWQSKGGVDRTVPLPKGWKQWMPDIIPLNKSERTFQRKFKQYAKKAKLSEKYVFHSLRHSFGTRCVEQGIPINQIQLLMGHSSLSVTNVYTKARPQDALKSYEELF